MLNIASPQIESYSSIDSELWRQSFLIRRTEEKLLELFREGKLSGTVHTCVGQEWTGVAVAHHLQPQDYIFSNHRCHGHFLARTGDVKGLIAEIMGKQSGVCGGRGGSQHLCSKGFFSNGIQGGITPVATGLGFAQKLSENDGISVVFIGDGTLGEGAVYESLNICSKWQLPVLFILENNLYAQSTSQSQTLAGSITGRAEAFDIDTAVLATWDPGELVERIGTTITKVRRTCTPAFVQIDTYRLNAHSKGDDDREPAEIELYRSKDPISIYLEQSQAARLLWEEVEQEVDRASIEAENDDFSFEQEQSPHPEDLQFGPLPDSPKKRVVERIRTSLLNHMKANEKLVLLGEDIESPYGGAFKVTKDVDTHDRNRAKNTPISEAAIIGIGTGLAMAGYRPVCEIMFGDFLMLAGDQILNHAAKFSYMYNRQVSVPLVIRTPMGGRRGYGPTHSQSLEKHFLGIPDLLVVAPNNRFDPAVLYDKLLSATKQPVLMVENKVLYAKNMQETPPEGFSVQVSNELFPTVRVHTDECPDVTIVCYGEMLTHAEEAALKAFDEDEIICEILCLQQIHPLPLQAITRSLEHSQRLLVLEEGIGFAGFGSEVVAQAVETVSEPLKACRRVSGPNHPIPSAKQWELNVLPSVDSIYSAIVNICT